MTKKTFLIFIIVCILPFASHAKETYVLNPYNKADNVCVDTHLNIICNRNPKLGTSGKIRVFDAKTGEAVDSDSVISNSDTLVMETQSAKLESKYASVSVTMTLPVGSCAPGGAQAQSGTGVAQTIRQSLLTLMGTQIYKDADYGGENTVNGKPYSGDMSDLKAICNFYCKAIFKPIEKQNKEEYLLNVQSIDKDTSLTEEQRKSWRSSFPTYEQDIVLSKVSEAANYIVFNDMSYGDRGGAHGGVSGYGYIIFNRTTGKQVKTVIKPGSARKMQRLLMNGLKQYFKDCGEKVPSDKELMEQLFLPVPSSARLKTYDYKTRCEDGVNYIPLPKFNGIAPTKEGLTFVYSQYEIGPYALGMPTFTIPYDKVRGFMTKEALELLKQ